MDVESLDTEWIQADDASMISRIWVIVDDPDFVLLGRGPKASPEIFSSGPGYLLSGGGVSRG